MSGFFSPAALEQVRSASDIVDVIGSYIPLKRAGANFTALCPFHKEKSPSFNVNPQRQIFHCFGCHKGGDVFTFVKEYENIPFPDAVRRLADRAKIPLETESSPGQQLSRHVKDQLLHLHEQITQRWQNALANEASGQAARDYLAKRGVSDEAAKLFRLGAAPAAWDDTVNWATSKGFDLALVEQGGLILRREGAEGFYDRFRGRLMFPICDDQGRVIGFSGRVLDPETKTAKYVNSPETPIFTKGRVFFGLDKSKRALLDAQSAIVCEGQLDLIACYMAGVQNIVAPQGTALTADHARILKRYVDEVVLCFDSDNAGQNAAVRSLDSLLASGLAIRVAVVPEPHDPDSFIKESGGDAFKKLIADAQGFFDYYLGRLCATNDVASDKGRLTVLEAMAAAVHKTENNVLIDIYAQKTAQKLGVSPESVKLEFKKALRKRVAGRSPEEPKSDALTPNSTALRPTTHEFVLVKFLAEDSENAAWIAEHLDPMWVENSTVRSIVLKCLELHKKNEWRDVPSFISEFDDVAVRQLITEALTRPLVVNIDGTKIPRSSELPDVVGQLTGMLTSMRNAYLQKEIAAIKNRGGDAQISDSEVIELRQRLNALNELKRQPLQAKPSGADEPF